MVQKRLCTSNTDGLGRFWNYVNKNLLNLLQRRNKSVIMSAIAENWTKMKRFRLRMIFLLGNNAAKPQSGNKSDGNEADYF